MRNRALWIILGAAVAVRASLLLAGWNRPDRFFTPDSHDYDALARGLLDRGEFARDGRPELFRTPGYPLLLAGVYAVTGRSIQAAVAAQIILDAALCLLVYVLGRELCSRTVGLVAAAAQAISPAAIVASVRLLSGGLFALLMTAALVLLVRCLKSPRVLPAVAAGVLTGAACLVRPIGLPLAVIGALALLSRIKRWRPALAFAAATAVILMPWVARNYLRAGYAALAGVGDYNLFYCNAAAIVEGDPQISLSREQQRLVELREETGQAWPEPQRLNDPQFLRQCRREGLALIAAHPLKYAAVHLRTTPNVFLPAATDVLEVLGVTAGGKGTLAVLRRQGIIQAIRHYFGGQLWALWVCVPMVLAVGVKYAAALASVAGTRWLKAGAAHWLLRLTFLYLVLVPGPVAHARFRVPIAPLLSLAAAAGICGLLGRLRRSKREEVSG